MSANPNAISVGIRETWANEYQVAHHKVPVYPAISNFRLAAGLKVGDTVNRQYRNSKVAYDMAGDGGYYRQALVDQNEQLTISKEKESSFYIKELDELQNHLPTRAKHAYDSSAAIFNQIDGDVLGNYDQFTGLDAGDLGGTSGQGIVLSTANVRPIFARATKKLQRQNIMIDQNAKFTGFRKEDSETERGVAILSPDFYQTLLESLDGKESILGDKVGINGHAGRYFGYDLFVSNAVGWSGVLALNTLPTDGDTVVVNGVTFTFETGSLDAAGKVKAETDADTSRANLVAAINDSEGLALYKGGSGAAGTAYYELSVANRALMLNITATNSNSANTLSLKATGLGFVTVSETLVAAADVWTTTSQQQHCLFGVANAIDVVIQKTPNMKVKDRDGKVGSDVVTWAAYGHKVFHDGTVKMIDAKIDTSLFA
jgi:hypothetical protein